MAKVIHGLCHCTLFIVPEFVVDVTIQENQLILPNVLCSIQRYAVIPLSTNSGLIGWVPHCDTLHALIRDYREKKKILLNIEHRIMLRVSQ